MTPIEVMAKLVEECGHTPLINEKHNFISINTHRSGKSPDEWYRLTIKKTQITIAKVNMKTTHTKGQFAFIPEKRILLSIDLRDPRSLDAIRRLFKNYDDQN